MDKFGQQKLRNTHPSHIDSQTADQQTFLIIGPVGRGKTTFINQVTNSNFKTSKSVNSMTLEPQEAFTQSRKIRLLDFPGFGGRSDDVMNFYCHFTNYLRDQKVHGFLFTLNANGDYRLHIDYLETLVVLQTLFDTAIKPYFIFTHVDQLVDDNNESLDQLQLRLHKFVGETYHNLRLDRSSTSGMVILSPICFNESQQLDNLICQAEGHSPIYLDTMAQYLDFESTVTKVLKKLKLLSKKNEHKYSTIDQEAIQHFRKHGKVQSWHDVSTEYYMLKQKGVDPKSRKRNHDQSLDVPMSDGKEEAWHGKICASGAKQEVYEDKEEDILQPIQKVNKGNPKTTQAVDEEHITTKSKKSIMIIQLQFCNNCRQHNPGGKYCNNCANLN